MKIVSRNLATYFVCARCEKRMGEIREAIGKLCDKVETVTGCCNLGDALNENGGCKAVEVDGEVQGMFGVVMWEKVFPEAKRKRLPTVNEIRTVVWL